MGKYTLEICSQFFYMRFDLDIVCQNLFPLLIKNWNSINVPIGLYWRIRKGFRFSSPPLTLIFNHNAGVTSIIYGKHMCWLEEKMVGDFFFLELLNNTKKIIVWMFDLHWFMESLILERHTHQKYNKQTIYMQQCVKGYTEWSNSVWSF